MIPRRIFIHCSATEDGQTVSWQAIRRYHMEVKGWADIGYHFGVELVNAEYEVLVGRMMDTAGAHCFGQNFNSLGVCLIGNFDKIPPPARQWDKASALVRGLCTTLSIPPSEIHAHRDYDSGKTCPGKMFNMGRFVGGLGL